MCIRDRNHKGAILTINDRATSRVWIRKLSGNEAIPVATIAVWALRKVKTLIHTTTADNGKEIAKHEEIAQKLEIKFYFCKPYHSWERGANEDVYKRQMYERPNFRILSGSSQSYCHQPRFMGESYSSTNQLGKHRHPL